MHAASREALNTAGNHLDTMLQTDNVVTTAAQTGIELFEVVSLLDEERTLRVAIADVATPAAQRAGIVDQLFAGKVAEPTLAVFKNAVALNWSTPRELRQGLVHLARRALLRGAEAQGQLAQVEEELFSLSRILARETELVQHLTDHNTDSGAKRGLLANVLYGKVSMFTEALALQVIGRPENNPIDDISNISTEAAALRGHSVASVVSAGELHEGQQANLAEKLGSIYGRAMTVHTEVDPSLLGGMVVRVGDEVIDGSTRSKLDRMRTSIS